MLTRKIRGRLVAGAVTMLLAAGLALPPPAAAGFAERHAKKQTCPRGRTLVDLDTKICPANKRRHSIVLKRACCEDRRGRVKCKPFIKCPKRSPSGDDD
jgi:hypothetical protein